MKYRDPITGELKEIYLPPTGDTLPVGAIVDYDGDTAPIGYEEVDDPNEYSFDEKIIGKWLDGKPIYRKVLATGKLPNNAEIRVNTGVENLKIITHMEAISYVGDNLTQFPIPYIASATNYVELVYIGVDNQFRITTTNDKSSHDGYIIFEYTKTTD